MTNAMDKKRGKQITGIVLTELKKDVSVKHRELNEITNRIEKVMTHLALLKYVLSSEFYGKDVTVTVAQENEDRNTKTIQTQIHPTVKRNLPARRTQPSRKVALNNTTIQHSDSSTLQPSTSSSTASDPPSPEPSTSSCPPSSPPSSQSSSSSGYSSISSSPPSPPPSSHTSTPTDPEIVDISLEEDVDVCSSPATSPTEPEVVPDLVPLPQPVETVKPNVCSVVRNKFKYRLIIGNVSKWLPPEMREDDATYKWMVYLRDVPAKDNTYEASAMRQIRKVRYFLHESYKPHDIVEVTSFPFYLSRRGWGEFPVRVQLHFKHYTDRPLDVIHDLRLDLTFTGLQMLGSETVIDLHLHSNEKDTNPQGPEVPKPIPFIRKRSQWGINPIICSRLNEIEHNYYLKPGKKLTKFRENIKEVRIKTKTRGKFTVEGRTSINFALLTKKLKFTDVGVEIESLVGLLVKKWPLYTGRARHRTYRRLHPYAVATREEFFGQSRAKQSSAEWYRAKSTKKVMLSLRSMLNISEPMWSTRQILLWTRMHGHSPVLQSINNFGEKREIMKINRNIKNEKKTMTKKKKKKEEELEVVKKKDPFYTYDVNDTRFGWQTRCLMSRDGERYVDVEEVNALDKQRKMNAFSQNMPLMMQAAMMKRKYMDFANNATRQLNFKLNPTEFIGGMAINASAAILNRAVLEFTQDLLGKSLAKAWLRNEKSPPLSLEKEDVMKALISEPKFGIFTNHGLGMPRGYS